MSAIEPMPNGLVGAIMRAAITTEQRATDTEGQD